MRNVDQQDPGPIHSLCDYDYSLPDELIATEPLPRRDQSRMLIVGRQTGDLAHRGIVDLPRLLAPGDCLILNDTRVLPARLIGFRTATGGKWEGLYLGATPEGHWRLIGHSRGRLRPGEKLTITPVHNPDDRDELHLLLLEQESDGGWIAQPESDGSPHELLERFGTVPLPPYIKRAHATQNDRLRYQTVYARHPGAVAAPTAGLHLTPFLLDECRQRGIKTGFVTLHVGIGTFRPIAVEDLRQHRMHSEWCHVPQQTADLIVDTKQNGGRVVAVGTTTVRTLESAARFGSATAWEGETDLFIRPPYDFGIVDALLTNFHLPKSTLLVMVSALASRELIREAYEQAVKERYRFYSYGDAMLIL